MTTIYSVEELGLTPLEASIEDGVPNQGFFPTVGAIDNSLEAFTVNPDTQTFVPFISDIFPESTTDSHAFEVAPAEGAIEEPPTMAAVEVAEDTMEETIDIIPQVNIMEQPPTEETDPELEETPPIESEEGEKAEPNEDVIEGKAPKTYFIDFLLGVTKHMFVNCFCWQIDVLASVDLVFIVRYSI